MSRDPRIDAYIAKAQPFARPILEHVRERVHAVVPDVEETMKWSMPAYTLGGKIVLITAAFKAHAALNFWRGQELAASRRRPAHGPVRQAQVARRPAVRRRARPADPRSRRACASAPAPRKTKHEPKPPPRMHPEFAAALDKAPKAKAALDGFPPSRAARLFRMDRRSEAGRDPRRSASPPPIEWLREGKRRHWKYENC